MDPWKISVLTFLGLLLFYFRFRYPVVQTILIDTRKPKTIGECRRTGTLKASMKIWSSGIIGQGFERYTGDLHIEITPDSESMVSYVIKDEKGTVQFSGTARLSVFDDWFAI